MRGVAVAWCRSRQVEPRMSGYLPSLVVSDFWLLRRNYVQLNDTVPVVPLTIWFNTYCESL